MRSTLIAGLFGVSLLIPTLPAQALYIHDMCGGTPSEGAGMTCPPGDYYLIRPLFSDGTCGDWVCCPKNAGGPSTGYNCEQGGATHKRRDYRYSQKVPGPPRPPKPHCGSGHDQAGCPVNDRADHAPRGGQRAAGHRDGQSVRHLP